MIKFLSDNIWTTITALSKKSRNRKIAVAYFGTGVTDLLRLENGDTLIVAMGLRNVKTGQVNPFEIEKLYNKGVKIFNLSNLHSKIYLFDKKVIIGSANVSSNSAEILIETALLTDDSKIISQADKFIDEHCIEKIEQDYINVCKANYKPPTFFYAGRTQTSQKFKGLLSSLWVISTHSTTWKSDDDSILKKNQSIFQKKLTNKKIFELSEVKYSASHPFINKVKEGDIIIEIFKQKVKTKVIQPKRALGVTWDKERGIAFLRIEERKKPLLKSWTVFERILRRNNIKSISKNSTREIINENTKKILLDCFN